MFELVKECPCTCIASVQSLDVPEATLASDLARAVPTCVDVDSLTLADGRIGLNGAGPLDSLRLDRIMPDCIQVPFALDQGD